MSNKIENYRGYNIWKNTKAVWKRDCGIPDGGFFDNKTLKGFYLSGKGASVEQIFYTIEKAKEHVDFILKFSLDY